MTRQALYYYADSKEELLKACADIAHEQLSKARRDAAGEATGLARVRAYFRAHLAVGCDDFGRCLLLNEPRDLSEAHRAWLDVELKKRNKAIEAMIHAGIDDGSMATCDAVNVRRMLFATFNAAPRWLHVRGERAIAAEADRLFAIIENGLAPGQRDIGSLVRSRAKLSEGPR